MTDSKTVKLTVREAASNDNVRRKSAILPGGTRPGSMRTPSHSSPDGHRIAPVLTGRLPHW